MERSASLQFRKMKLSRAWARATASLQILALTESQPISEESLRSANHLGIRRLSSFGIKSHYPKGCFASTRSEEETGKRMGKFFIMGAVAAAACALLLVSPALAGGRLRSSRTTEERAVRALISEWVE